MYEYFCAFIVGIVEGLTEYIPVSSTGHLILAGHMLGFVGEKADVFEVFIQLGAILSVLAVYKKKFSFMIHRRNWFLKRGISCWNIGVGMFPALVVGYLCHGFIKSRLFSPSTVIIGLVAGGIFMICAEHFHKKFTVMDADQITSGQALRIGLFQCLALWPGFSRSGSTISGALFLGVSRKAAADFSFIMAVPLMFIACIYDLLKIFKELTWSDFGLFALGFLTSFAVAYISILWFLKFLNKSTLTGFAYYRFMMAAVAFVYFL